jgi:peptide-methionine (S)-S-oxide reductase
VHRQQLLGAASGAWRLSAVKGASRFLTFSFFRCVEAPFSELDGVDSAVSGYIGGRTANPTYRDICNGDTGHAEAVRITYDPAKLSFKQVLDVFFTVHDPTQLNRQGNDSGTQYRSAIFYTSPEQKAEAAAYIAAKQAEYKAPIVTTLEDGSQPWYEAEKYHQRYFVKEPNQPYVLGVVRPKVYKAREKFRELLKKDVK